MLFRNKLYTLNPINEVWKEPELTVSRACANASISQFSAAKVTNSDFTLHLESNLISMMNIKYILSIIQAFRTAYFQFQFG